MKSWLLTLLCLTLALPAMADGPTETFEPAVPEGEELFEPNWPEPCMDGETVEDPFCDEAGDGGSEGGTGFQCQYCRFTQEFVFQCSLVDVGETGNESCRTENGGADCYPEGRSCGRT